MIDIPSPVGFWNIGGEYGLLVASYRKPSRFQIWMHKILLGWDWKEHDS